MLKFNKKMLCVFIIILFLFTGCSNNNSFKTSYNSKLDTNVNIHFIDVGQGDSTLILLPNNKSILIDMGPHDSEINLNSYLKNNNIQSIDYLIITHFHEDHIGGFNSIFNDYDIKNVYMPDITINTKVFESLLLSIKEEKSNVIKVNQFNLSKIKFDNYIDFEFLAPNNIKYNDLNNYSLVTKLTYINNSFLFTGDAETISEKEMLSLNKLSKIDVLKVGHHGSDSSSSVAFLKKLNPQYFIISVGKNNDYNHPSEKILKRFNSKQSGPPTINIPSNILRTDLNGTIILNTDGYFIKQISQN